MYLLTSQGLEVKSLITARLLKVKLQEYAKLQAEIEELRNDSHQILNNLFHQAEIH
jgi:hypothetical protein